VGRPQLVRAAPPGEKWGGAALVRPSYVGALSALALSPVANRRAAAMTEMRARAATILHEVMLMDSPSWCCGAGGHGAIGSVPFCDR
jgi:hypothetical protein